MIWTNLNSGAMKCFTVPQSSNGYTVTGLSDNDNYALSIATVNVCGMMITSDPIAICGMNSNSSHVTNNMHM